MTVHCFKCAKPLWEKPEAIFPNGRTIRPFIILDAIADGRLAWFCKPCERELIAEIAVNLRSVLREQLTDDEWREMARRNRAEQDRSACHSHDFCDANMAMDAAFRRAGINPLAGEHMSDATISVWNAAWDKAKPSLKRN